MDEKFKAREALLQRRQAQHAAARERQLNQQAGHELLAQVLGPHAALDGTAAAFEGRPRLDRTQGVRQYSSTGLPDDGVVTGKPDDAAGRCYHDDGSGPPLPPPPPGDADASPDARHVSNDADYTDRRASQYGQYEHFEQYDDEEAYPYFNIVDFDDDGFYRTFEEAGLYDGDANDSYKAAVLGTSRQHHQLQRTLQDGEFEVQRPDMQSAFTAGELPAEASCASQTAPAGSGSATCTGSGDWVSALHSASSAAMEAVALANMRLSGEPEDAARLSAATSALSSEAACASPSSRAGHACDGGGAADAAAASEDGGGPLKGGRQSHSPVVVDTACSDTSDDDNDEDEDEDNDIYSNDFCSDTDEEDVESSEGDDTSGHESGDQQRLADAAADADDAAADVAGCSKAADGEDSTAPAAFLHKSRSRRSRPDQPPAPSISAAAAAGASPSHAVASGDLRGVIGDSGSTGADSETDSDGGGPGPLRQALHATQPLDQLEQELVNLWEGGRSSDKLELLGRLFQRNLQAAHLRNLGAAADHPPE